jgi:hypothetical protein
MALHNITDIATLQSILFPGTKSAMSQDLCHLLSRAGHLFVVIVHQKRTKQINELC